MSVFSLRTDEEITAVYNKYVDTVYRICYMLLKNEDESHDVCQNVFLKLIDCKKEFNSYEHIKAWLIVTAQNECKNILKHWWHSKRVDIDSIKDMPYSDNDDNSDVKQKLMSLPDKYRLPLYLHYYEGYSTQEIADMLGIKPSTLRTQLVTARNKLKLMLEEGEYE